MKKLIILALLLLSSCGKRQINIEPEFQEAFNSFESEASNRGRMLYNTNDITIRRGDMSLCVSQETASACCVRTVNIDRSSVDIIVKDSKILTGNDIKVLLYHEMAHCFLYKEHNAEELDGHPKSLMHPQIITFSQEYLAENWSYYVDEIFSY
jgi:hypothetical protein